MHYKLGTRASPLAMQQAFMVQKALIDHFPQLKIEICPMVSGGDKILDRPLAEIGGKGLFSKELDRALENKEIDFAVHSLKDLETIMPDSIIISAIFKRDDPRDALIFKPNSDKPILGIMDLPNGAKIGTASVRRRALLQAIRPDLQFELIRGNIQTRIAKVMEGQFDATLLAMAGLERMELRDSTPHIPLAIEDFLPAAGQGAIAVTSLHSAHRDLIGFLKAIDHQNTHYEIIAERALLKILDGSCNTPIAAFAKIKGNELSLKAKMVTPDGKMLHANGQGQFQDAEAIGIKAAKDILSQIA